MNKEVLDFWGRALLTLETARSIVTADPDSAASRAYYAAFNAVSALFQLRGKSFSKYTSLNTAVHRDLVQPGHWPKELGSAYTALMELRSRGDYGGSEHVLKEDAQDAIEAATRILRAVHSSDPEIFSDPKHIL